MNGGTIPYQAMFCGVPEMAIDYLPETPNKRIWTTNMRYSVVLYSAASYLPLRYIRVHTWMTGWWFGTFFIVPCIGNHHPN